MLTVGCIGQEIVQFCGHAFSYVQADVSKLPTILPNANNDEMQWAKD